MSDIRAEVMERLVDVIRDAEAKGLEGMKVAAETFPGTPTSVIAKAWTTNDMRQTEDWWKGVERTIDAAVVDQALLKNGSAA